MPAATPVSNPVLAPNVVTVATLVLLLLHAPPNVALLSTLVCPAHTVAIPVMAAGTGFTEIIVVLKQPVVAV